MAAAVTSGVVALMVEANRETYDAPLTPNTVKAILEYTALPLDVGRSADAGSRRTERRGRLVLSEKIDPAGLGDWWMSGPSCRGRSSTASPYMVADRCLGQYRGVGE